jgi:hypothetical protein
MRGGKDSGTYDRIGASIGCPFIERVDVVVSRNVLLDELVINRLRMHPLAKPCGGNRMERDVFWMSFIRRTDYWTGQVGADRIYARNISGR